MGVKLASKGNVVGVILLLTTSMAALAGGAASAQSVSTSAATAPAAAAPSAAVIAHNAKGRMRSKIVGTTANGRNVTGTFIPLKFKAKDGKVRARGLVNGVVHNEDGSTSTFSVIRSIRLKNVNGVPAGSARYGGSDSCDLLRLVLGPLDLDLLGLEVHLNRVVLTVVATPGPGNLLGNLLCDVAGLLDDGLGGQLGELSRLLNRILALLRLGI